MQNIQQGSNPSGLTSGSPSSEIVGLMCTRQPLRHGTVHQIQSGCGPQSAYGRDVHSAISCGLRILIWTVHYWISTRSGRCGNFRSHRAETFYDPLDEWWQKVETSVTEFFPNTVPMNQRFTKLEELPSQHQSQSIHLEGQIAALATRLRNLADNHIFTRTCSESKNHFTESIKSLCGRGEALSKRPGSEGRILE